ncbi:hypothetical protein H072_10271 [Dactylellina haptotyla CBS 200.50]|uniref:AB hydrolase-1 domain-containing protein n=1 Tax=Dactylellina haptotyla (strain CBS 200.50) TaxID=1284197 RepID=S8BLX9_DACHA|nr:hypothetical protein H072_10271 [Dactylellina haptotyla CBS 200.50]
MPQSTIINIVLGLILAGADAGVIPMESGGLLKRQPQLSNEQLFDGISEATNLEWHPCSNKTLEVKYGCARLSVPLDYNKPENGLRAIIPIIKYTASKGVPYKGTVLVNPGGPGGLGTEWVYQHFKPEHQNATEISQTKISGRRIKRDVGSNSRNDTDTGNFAYGARVPQEQLYDAPGALKYFDKKNAACFETVGAYNQAGPHMSTAVVATDMLSIGKALAREKGTPEDKTLVNFYGASYGTVIDSVDAVRERFNNITRKMDIFATKFAENPEKATAFDDIVKGFKAKIFESLYNPLYHWPKMAEYLIGVERILAPSNPSDWNTTAISDLGVNHAAENPKSRKPLGEFPDSYVNVACTDGRDVRALKNVTVEDQRCES